MESSRKDCCKGDCEETATERMNYFTGRHLAARDFEDEQKYHRTHRFLHNRMLHGWGVVCGLAVTPHGQPDCRNRYVNVSPGMAIDCCGREIIVDHAACCGDEEPPIPWVDYENSRKQGKDLLMLCLAYSECPIAMVPVLSSEGDCSTAATESKASRAKESWKLSWRWVAKSELAKYSWNPHCTTCPEPPPPGTEGNAEPEAQANEAYAQAPVQRVDVARQEVRDQPHDHEHSQVHHHDHDNHPQVHHHDECPHDDCGDPCKEGFRSCLEPKCPEGHCVPLAVLCVNGEKKTVTRIIMKGRPEVPNVPQRLTRIVDINWPHGHRLPSSWFERNPLEVTFDRKIDRPIQKRRYPGPTGVNPATFRVDFGEGSGFEDLDIVPFVRPPFLRKDQIHARYWVDRDHRHKDFTYLENHVVWITIKCDFLLDCHGVAVDGNNNGTPGGTFESWVYVVSDSEYNDYKKLDDSDDYDDEDEQDEPGEEPMRLAV